MKPVYDINKTFEENKHTGPFFSGNIPERSVPAAEYWYNFCGYNIASRIGVAACPLTATSRGVQLCSRLGFDVITYKTIRSTASPAHAWPNITYIDVLGQLETKDLDRSIQQSYIPSYAITNSIGNASDGLAIALADIEKARALLLPGQLLIISIYGTGNSQQELMQDFVLLAQKAQDAGAQIIEANFSCPNIHQDGELYMDSQLVYAVTRAITHAISIPLFIKVGLLSDISQMRTVLRAAACAGARGITGINAVRMKVVNELNQPVFGNTRVYSGISGEPIRNLALSFLRDAITINDQEKLELTFVGMGGVMQPEQVNQFLDAGATVVQSATGAMWNPYLAMKYHTMENK